MRANPKGDWTISDIQKVSGDIGLVCTNPTRGSHYKVSSAHIDGILSVPHKRPIKVTYIKSFIGLVEAHVSAAAQKGKTNG